MVIDARSMDYTALNDALRPILEEYCCLQTILGGTFTVVTPDSANPHKQMYVAN